MLKNISYVICFLILYSSRLGLQTDSFAQATNRHPADSSLKVQAYYFHATFRCATCLEMEKWTRDIITKKYPEQLKKGVLTLQSFNFDEEKNFDFLNRYSLARPAVILAKYRGDREITWKSLDRIWDFNASEAEFKKYIDAEVSQFLSIKPPELYSKKRQRQDKQKK